MGIPPQKDYGQWWDQRSSRERLFTKIKPKMFGAKFVTTPEKAAKPSLVSAVQEKFNDPKFMPNPQTQLAPKPSIVSILSETGLIEAIPKKKSPKEPTESVDTSATSSMSSMVVTELTETVYKARKVIGKVIKDEDTGNTAIDSEEKSEESDAVSELTPEPDKGINKRIKGDTKNATPNTQEQIRDKRPGVISGFKKKRGEEVEDTIETKNEKILKSKWKAEMEMLMAKQSTNQTREDILAQEEASLKTKKLKNKSEFEEEDGDALSETEVVNQNYDRKHGKQIETDTVEPSSKLHRSNKFHGLLTEENFDLTESLAKYTQKPKPKSIKRHVTEDEEETEADEVSAEVSPEEKPKEKHSRQLKLVAEELGDDPKFIRVSKVQKEKQKVTVRTPSPEYNDVELEEELEEIEEALPEIVDKRERKIKDYTKKISSRAPTPYHHEDEPLEDEDELIHHKEEAKKKSGKKRAQVLPSVDEEFLRITEEFTSKKPLKGKKKVSAGTARIPTPYQSREYHQPEQFEKQGRKRGEVNDQNEALLADSAGQKLALEFESEAEQMAAQEKRKHKLKQQATTLVTTGQAAMKDKKKKEILGHLSPVDMRDDTEQMAIKQLDKKKGKKNKELGKNQKEIISDISPQSEKKKLKKATKEEYIQNSVLPSLPKEKAKHKETKKKGDEAESQGSTIPETILKKMKKLLAEEIAISGKAAGKKGHSAEKTLQKYQDEFIKLMSQGNKHLTVDTTEIRKHKHLPGKATEDGRSETEESGRLSRASTLSVTSIASSSMKSPVSRAEHKRKHRTLEITLHVATLSSINEEEKLKKGKKRRSMEEDAENEAEHNSYPPMLPFVKLSEASPPHSSQGQNHFLVDSGVRTPKALNEPILSYDSHSSRKADNSKATPVHAQLSVKSVLDHIPELIPADTELTTAEEEDIRYIVSQIISTQMSNGDLTADGPPITPEEAKMQAENVQSLISQILSPKNSRGDSHPANAMTPEAEAMQESENILKAITEQSSMNNYNIDAVLRSVAAILAKQEELIELSKVSTDKKKTDRKTRDKKKMEKMAPVVEQEPDSEEESKFSVSEVAIANDSELVDISDAMDDLATIADDVSMDSSNEGSFVAPEEETVTEEHTVLSESRSVSAAKGSSGTEWSQSDTNSGEEAAATIGRSPQIREGGEASDTSLQPSSTNLQSEASVETSSLRRPIGECNTIQEEEEEETNSDSDEGEQNMNRRPQKGPQPLKKSRVDNYSKTRPPMPIQKGPHFHVVQPKGHQSIVGKYLQTKNNEEDNETSSETESID